MKTWIAVLGIAGSCLAAGSGKTGISWEKLRIDDKTDLTYALALPKGAEKIDAKRKAKAGPGCPLVVVLPGGGGSKEEVEGALSYFVDEGTARGWIVVGPEAPGGRLFFQEGEKALEPLVKHLKETYRVEDGQVHMAGVSNGGIGAFHTLVVHPDLWASVLTLPGTLFSRDELPMLAALTGKPITMYAGENDELGYQKGSRRIAAALDEKKVPYTLNIRKGEGHIMPIPSAALLDDLDRHRKTIKEAGKGADRPKEKKPTP